MPAWNHREEAPEYPDHALMKKQQLCRNRYFDFRRAAVFSDYSSWSVTYPEDHCSFQWSH